MSLKVGKTKISKRALVVAASLVWAGLVTGAFYYTFR